MFANILLVLETAGIEYEHIIDDDQYAEVQDEFVMINDSNIVLDAEQYLDGIGYRITERDSNTGYSGLLLDTVSESCFCNVVSHIVKDHLDN